MTIVAILALCVAALTIGLMVWALWREDHSRAAHDAEALRQRMARRALREQIKRGREAD